MKYAIRAALLVSSAFLLGCSTVKSLQRADKLPVSNKMSIGEVAVYEGLKKDGEVDLNDPYYAGVLKSYLENLEKNLKESDFLVEGAGCADCLVIKTKLNNKKPLLGGALGIMAMGTIRARVEVYDKDVKVYSFTSEVLTDLFFGPAAQIRRGIAPWIAKQLKKDFRPKGEK